uniref:Uncharacterized protein n=1 Tax=Hippocampus comes TaxID=109280 RepID=A0A3Q3DKX6_HIPCM
NDSTMGFFLHFFSSYHHYLPALILGGVLPCPSLLSLKPTSSCSPNQAILISQAGKEEAGRTSRLWSPRSADNQKGCAPGSKRHPGEVAARWGA